MKDWLVQDYKKEEDHLNIELLQLCCFMMPMYNKTKLDCVHDNK